MAKRPKWLRRGRNKPKRRPRGKRVAGRVFADAIAEFAATLAREVWHGWTGKRDHPDAIEMVKRPDGSYGAPPRLPAGKQ